MCPGQRMQLAARGLPLKAGSLQSTLRVRPSGLCLSSPFLSAIRVLNSKQGQESIKRNYGVTPGIPGSHGSLF